MSKITVTTKTPAQITADFESVFKEIKPLAATRPVTQADRLEPYRKAIMKQRKRGLTWKQIAEGMARPRIDEPVTERLLKRIFGHRAAPAQNTSTPSAVAPATSPSATPTPPKK